MGVNKLTMKSRSKSTGEAMVSNSMRVTKTRRASMGGSYVKRQVEQLEKNASSVTGKTEPLDLDNNPDYIALNSALSLLEGQKKSAQEDIIKLSQLKQQALEEPETIYEQLARDGSIMGVPKPQSVVKVPVIPFEKYGIENPRLTRRLNRGIMDTVSGYGAVRLFEDNFGDRERRNLSM